MSQNIIASPATTPDLTIRILIDAWNRHDMPAFAALFAPDADFVNVVGMRLRGRAEIDAAHVTLHRTIFRNSHLTSKSQTVRLLSPTVALLHLHWEMTGAEGLPGWEVGEIRRGILSLVLVEEDGQWLVASAQNTDTLPLTMPQ